MYMLWLLRKFTAVFSSQSKAATFVCSQYPVFGHSKDRGPTEISFANRWELVGPLGWKACFSRFSQECCRIYWFSGEKKITIPTSSLQFFSACRKAIQFMWVACWENFPLWQLCGLHAERMMDLLQTFSTCASSNKMMLICFVLKFHLFQMTKLS